MMYFSRFRDSQFKLNGLVSAYSKMDSSVKPEINIFVPSELKARPVGEVVWFFIEKESTGVTLAR